MAQRLPPLEVVAALTWKQGPKGPFLLGHVAETVTLREGSTVMVFRNDLTPSPDCNLVRPPPSDQPDRARIDAETVRVADRTVEVQKTAAAAWEGTLDASGQDEQRWNWLQRK